MSVARVEAKKTDGPISRLLNRRLSAPITMFIVRHNIPLTPNQVSLISFALAAASGAAFALGNPFLGGILAQASSVIDGVDGELARARGMTSRSGGFMDAVLDRYADTIILIGLILYANMLYPATPLLLLLYALALAGDYMVSYVHARGEATLKTHPALIGRVPQFASRDVRLFIVFIGGLAARPLETLAAIAFLGNAYAVAKTVDAFLAYRALERKG